MPARARTARLPALLLAVLATAGCSYSPAQIAAAEAERQDELARALDGFSPAPARDCMPIDQTGGPQVIGGGVALYREGGRRIWVARTAGECPALRPDTVLITEVTGTQLCRNDRFRTLDRGTSIPSGYCRFDSFTPYDRN